MRFRLHALLTGAGGSLLGYQCASLGLRSSGGNPAVASCVIGFTAAGAAVARSKLQECWSSGNQGGAAPFSVLTCGITAARAAATATGGEGKGEGQGEEELGDLRPGMSVEEEEDDEAEHYTFRGHVKRRRLRPHPEQPRLDEEEPPPEEAPGEEAYKEAGPLLPPDDEEEDVESEEEPAAPAGGRPRGGSM